MKKKAVEAADRIIGQLEEDYNRLVNARNADEASDAWTDFISHHQRLYNKLTIGAHGKSQQWLNGKKAERKSDPLLKFIHQARHADEHLLEDIHQEETTLIIAAPEDGREILFGGIIINHDGSALVHAEDNYGNPVGHADIIRVDRIGLRPFANRGISYDLPSTHLGREIGSSVIMNARLLMAHAKALVEEARTLQETN